MPATIRISDHSHGVLSQLAREASLPMIQVLDAALESFRRQQFLERANAAYSALHADEQAWAGYTQETASMDGTAGDGLEEATP